MLKHIGTLGRKRQNTNAEFAEGCARATDLISMAHMRDVIDETMTRYQAIQHKYGFRRFAVAYSGGKDSLAMHHLFPEHPFFWVRCNLEYQTVSNFMAGTGCEVVNTGQDLEWLAEHPQHLFPTGSAGVTRWSEMVHWTGQVQYFKTRGLDCMLMGRRKKDGNRMGRHDEDLYSNNDGTTRFAPIWLWTHEETFAYLAYNNVAMPPCYQWPDGFRISTNPWPKRRSPSIAVGWERVHEVEPHIVYNAAGYLPSAREWLDRHLNMTEREAVYGRK